MTFEKPVSLGDLMLTHLSTTPGAHWVSMVLISWNSIRVQSLEARAVTDSDAEQWRHTSWKLNPFPYYIPTPQRRNSGRRTPREQSTQYVLETLELVCPLRKLQFKAFRQFDITFDSCASVCWSHCYRLNAISSFVCRSPILQIVTTVLKKDEKWSS